MNGNIGSVTSTALTINGATSTTGVGGVFYLALTGSSSMSLTNPTFNTIVAATSGGIVAL